MVLCMFLKDSRWYRPGRHEHPGSGCVCHCVWCGFEEAGRGGGDPHQVLQLLQRGHHGTGVLDHVVRKTGLGGIRIKLVWSSTRGFFFFFMLCNIPVPLQVCPYWYHVPRSWQDCWDGQCWPIVCQFGKIHRLLYHWTCHPWLSCAARHLLHHYKEKPVHLPLGDIHSSGNSLRNKLQVIKLTAAYISHLLHTHLFVLPGCKMSNTEVPVLQHTHFSLYKHTCTYLSSSYTHTSSIPCYLALPLCPWWWSAWRKITAFPSTSAVSSCPLVRRSTWTELLCSSVWLPFSSLSWTTLLLTSSKSLPSCKP